MICPHVHCRDGKERYKTTIFEVILLARAQDISMVFDMPNTKPPITTRKRIQKRLKLVPVQFRENYRLYVGLTARPKQIEEAVQCYLEFPEVVGFKLFAGKSVGSLAVVEDEKQRRIYQDVTDLKYTGVLPVHCEREADLKPEIWDPRNPISHSFARPKQAEINSVANQIRFAKDAGFAGILHICHISCPEAVELVVQARRDGMRITCGVTPHHLIYDMTEQNRPRGLLWKVNPPLRSREDVLGLREDVKAGKIDWIESDHAQHALREKLYPPYLSGIPSLYIHRYFVGEFLPRLGLTSTQIADLTYGNIVRTFKDKLK